MLVYLLLIIVALIAAAWLYNLIVDSVHKSTAERRMRMYPHAVKGVFGYCYNVSLNKKRDINIFVAPAHNEQFWKDTEKTELERVSRCKRLEERYPNGYKSWCILNEKNKEDLKLVDKSSNIIVSLDEKYSTYRAHNIWKERQGCISNLIHWETKGTIPCVVPSCDRFGNEKEDFFQIQHYFVCYNETRSTINLTQYMSDVNSFCNEVNNSGQNIVYVTLNGLDHVTNMFLSKGERMISIQGVFKSQWNDDQVFILLADSIEQLEAKFYCEMILSKLHQPIVVVFSICKEISDVEYNLQKYKSHSIKHNIENNHSLDNLLEVHSYQNGFYYTVKKQKCLSLKKAISENFKTFDTDAIAERTSKKYKYSYSSPYYNKSVDEIKLMWAQKRENSARTNKKLRNDISCILSNTPFSSDETNTLFKQFDKIWNISPYRTDWKIFDRMSGIVATVDCLAYMNNKFVLFSWVRTDSALEDYFCAFDETTKYIVDDHRKSKYIKCFYDYGLEGTPFNKMSDCKFTKYSIEQEVIKYILKHNYGIVVDESYIVILHPKYKRPIGFRPNMVTEEVSVFMMLKKQNFTPCIDSEENNSMSFVSEEEIETIDSIELF